MNIPENQIIVIFGASGDLTKRKLIPALFSLQIQKLLPEKFAISGVSRTEMSDENFREAMNDGIQKFSKETDKSQLSLFLSKIFYQSVNASESASYQGLINKLSFLQNKLQINENIIFYLSTPPSLYGLIPQNLAKNDLNNEKEGWKRLIIEKPFGYDLKSATQLNLILKADWKEEQIYRIDHYLGKETVQNVMVTRFTNGIFEPLWNRNYIDHVEITSSESI